MQRAKISLSKRSWTAVLVGSASLGAAFLFPICSQADGKVIVARCTIFPHETLYSDMFEEVNDSATLRKTNIVAGEEIKSIAECDGKTVLQNLTKNEIIGTKDVVAPYLEMSADKPYLVYLRLSTEERERVGAAAKKAGLSVSAFAQKCVDDAIGSLGDGAKKTSAK